MISSESGVTCDTHGEANATFVCRHLISRPKQRWICDYPSKRNHWPDAWCVDCNRRHKKNGKWTKGIGSEIKVLCHHCYEDRRSIGSTYLDAKTRTAWRRYVAECRKALHGKQHALEKDFALGKHKRWDWNQDTGQIVFSNDGVPAVTARVHFIGSVSTAGGTWLWSWANPSHDRKVRDASKKIRAFGEKHGFQRLTIPKWKGDEVDGWDMAAIGAAILKADGVYRTPGQNGFLFMAMVKTRQAG